MGFEVNVNREDNTTVIHFRGIFDESAVLPEAEEFFGCKELIVDFQGLKFMNSAGIAIYLRFIQKIEAEGVHFVYRNCTKAVVNQANTIMGFLPENSKVESFYLPIFCQKCQKNFDFLMQTKDFKPEDIEVREITKDVDCEEMPSCKKHHSLDVIPRRYFRFLARNS